MGRFYLGADVSKGYADFILIDENRNVVEQCFRLDDSQKGHSALERWLQGFLSKRPDSMICFGVESTGGYENNWLNSGYKLSKSMPICSARINPCGIKKFMDAELKRTVNDQVSAECIAKYMIAHPDKVLYDQDDPFYSLRRQWTSLCLLKKVLTQLTNNLQSLLYTANPEVLIYCRKGIPGWLLSVLERYPTAVLLAKARVQKLASIKHVGDKKAEALLRYAKSDVASTVDSDMASIIKGLLMQIRSITASISEIENQLIKKWKDHPTIALIHSINGIGVISAIGLMINIRDVKLFPSVKQLASYFGLHPIWKESGDGSWGFHMSKIGRSQPRSILFMTTMASIIYNPVIKHLYAQCLHNKMKKMAAIGVCMHKMLRIVYGVLKTQKPFDPAIDQKNKTEKKPQEKNGAQQQYEKKLRRFQNSDLDAPISRRQAIKRKRSNGSQNDNVVKCGITTPLIDNIENVKEQCKHSLESVI